MRDETAERLKPADREDFRTQLTACLMLVVPTGMTKEERNTWLRAAWATVGHLPADLLKRGCANARRIADHPSKIVPAILRDADAEIARRRRTVSECDSDIAMIEEQIAENREARAADERAREIAKQAPKSLAPPPNHRAYPIEPTRADYIAMGIDPAVLNKIDQEEVGQGLTQSKVDDENIPSNTGVESE